MEKYTNPILKDFQEKKHNLMKMASEVGSMASELKDLRSRVALQEASFAKESASRQVAEAKARSLESEKKELQNSLEEKSHQLQVSSSVAQQYQRELDDVRGRFKDLETSARESAALAQSAELHSASLLKELDEKTRLLNEYETRVTVLGQRIDELNESLSSRETLQQSLKDEVLRMEQDINLAISKATAHKDCELKRIADEVSTKNYEKLSRHLKLKDEEIARLKEETKAMSIQWKLRTQELESQLEKHRRADQEIRKRVLKLEFCLHDARAQTRKLQRLAEKRDKAIKELREELQSSKIVEPTPEKPKFWETSGFKVAASVSMVVLVIFCRR